MPANWKKGRGKLGPLEPLLGAWSTTETDPKRPQGRCDRTFEKVLGGHYVQLTARWSLDDGGNDRAFTEHCVLGPGEDGGLAFWSFTSDGKRSQGQSAKAEDIHPDAVCFEAQMPAGLARFIYWPADDEGFRFAVEAKTKKGWSRFLNHHYRRVDV